MKNNWLRIGITVLVLLLSSLTIAGCGDADSEQKARAKQQIKIDTVPRWTLTDHQGKIHQAKKCDTFQGAMYCTLMDDRRIYLIGNASTVETKEWAP